MCKHGVLALTLLLPSCKKCNVMQWMGMVHNSFVNPWDLHLMPIDKQQQGLLAV